MVVGTHVSLSFYTVQWYNGAWSVHMLYGKCQNHMKIAVSQWLTLKGKWNNNKKIKIWKYIKVSKNA